MKATAVFFAMLAALLLSVSATAKDAAPTAQDQATEQRMIAISQDLRCLVCQNESLAGSRADLAEDLRREIRGLIREGKSDQEITDYLVNRYGDFVLYKPPLKSTTWLLWFGPFLLLVIAVGALLVFLNRRNRGFGGQSNEDRPLTPNEQQRADALLRDSDGHTP
jgi:cytochrome c-type biogenesis protein CcmH